MSWFDRFDPSTPQGMQLAGLLGGFNALGAGLLQAGAPRPVGQPGPTLADAFGAFGQGQQRGLQGAMQTQQLGQQMRQQAAWRDAASGRPTTPEGRALFESVPEGRRAAIFQMGPQMGMEALKGLVTQRPVAVSPGQTLVGLDGPGQRVPYTPEDFAYRQAGRSVQSVSVDQGPQVGTIPQGYQLQKVDGGWRMAPIPGGPAEREIAATDRKAQAERANTTRAGDIVVQDIDRALGLGRDAVLPTAGLGASTLAKVPGTAAADTSRLLDSVKANVSFQTLTEMRKASPTGGALGAVSDREMSLLQAALGSLEQSQSPGQFRDNLVRVRNLYLDIVHGPGQGPERLPLSFQQTAPGGRGTIEPPGAGATMRWNPQTQRVEPVR